jgi:hypothetical protein
MNAIRPAIILLIVIATVACSRKGDESPAAAAPATDAHAPAAPAPAASDDCGCNR